MPKEWASLTEAQWAVGSLASFKRGSRDGFLGLYRAFVCRDPGCGVCGRGGRRPHSVDTGDG